MVPRVVPPTSFSHSTALLHLTHEPTHLTHSYLPTLARTTYIPSPVCNTRILLLAMKLVTLTLALLLGPALAAPNNPERTFMVWMLADANTTSAAWDARAANIKAHSANLTSVSPCIYGISASGTFAPGTGPRPYALLYPHMKEMQAMGLQVIPLIAGPPNTAGQQAGVRNPP